MASTVVRTAPSGREAHGVSIVDTVLEHEHDKRPAISREKRTTSYEELIELAAVPRKRRRLPGGVTPQS
jgi:hypothetical protein